MNSDVGSDRRTVVIGLGSPLMGDDGLGLVALEVLRDGWCFDALVELVDGGTWGMSLLPWIEQADRLLLLDAIHCGDEPGTLVRLDREEIPRFLSMKISPHQIDLREVLAVAELRGTLPVETAALGLQPGVVEFSESLTEEVADQVAALAASVCRQLEDWGHDVRRRPDAPSLDEGTPTGTDAMCEGGAPCMR